MGKYFIGMVVMLTWMGEAGAEEISAANCVHGVSAFNCVQFVKNHDGDTVTVEIHDVHPLIGHDITVRVVGIDAPEMDSQNACERAAAVKAQQEVEQILKRARRIDLKNIGRDKYFRVLADVQVDGKSLGEEMLNAKLAVPYDGGTKQRTDWCRR